ncbi:structural protein [Cellulophaga phage phi46:1]|uniref:structural protein n=1 Tax=Cellulophaga phage phi46:1 TaxID=1327974 RepID=UPI000351EF29|nr:structural protein [Cellulophaga phage phi46:1]AGO47830.1 structural protein [Cellulophaga phage phi46:1]
MSFYFIKDIQTSTENGVYYPAFNDAWIQYVSSFGAGVTNSVITVTSNSDAFPSPFFVYPDKNTHFWFNLKELAKAQFAGSEFQFTETDGLMRDVICKLDIEIAVYYNNGANVDKTTRTFYFMKAVNQVGQVWETPLFMSGKIINYFKGFPLYFQISQGKALDNFRLYNEKHDEVSNLNGFVHGALTDNDVFSPSLSNYIEQRGLFNYPEETFYLQPILKNEGYEPFEIRQHDKCEGVYLRWINSNGGENYYLFDSEYVQTTRANSLDEVYRNDFRNVDAYVSRYRGLGRTAVRSLSIKASVKKDVINLIEDLLISPNIELYSSFTPDLNGSWLPVTLSNNFSKPSKNRNYIDVGLTITLPELNTLHY